MITHERKRELSGDKLTGLEEIACYLHWSLSNTKRKVKQWQKARSPFAAQHKPTIQPFPLLQYRPSETIKEIDTEQKRGNYETRKKQ